MDYSKHIYNLKTEDVHYFAHDRKNSHEITCYKSTLSNVYINNYYHISNKWALKQESYDHAPALENASFIRKTYWAVKNAFLHKSNLECGIWIINPWSHFYYHWLVETLPRLFEVRNEIKAPVILPHRYKNYDFVHESLQVFKAKPYFLNSNEVIRVKKLRYQSVFAPTGYFDNEKFYNYKSFLTDYIKEIDYKSPYGKYLYISRGNGLGRKIVNEKEVIEVLAASGFDVIEFNNHSWPEQLKIASEAKIMVGPHGGGLSNLMCMQGNSSLLELRPEGHFYYNCFFDLSIASKIKYYYQLCEPTNKEIDSHKSDLLVNIDLLKENITQIKKHIE
jgi:capsular polysaccharide biosynthesis protein